MANPIRGEVSFQCGDETYVLLVDMNALCTLEADRGYNVAEIGGTLKDGKGGVVFLRDVLWAGLQDHHPKLSLKQAGRIMGELNVAETEALIVKSMNLAFPRVEDAKAPADPPRPARKAGRGTSRRSSRPGAS